MLEFIPYQKETEIHGLPFIAGKQGPYTVICPHPSLADSSRLFFSSDAQVLTISRFVKDQLALAYPDKEISSKGKADLLLFLSGVWRSRIGPQKLETFKQAFKLFTELRSFTLDLNLIEEILEEFAEEVQAAIKLFWLVCEQLELVDEHKTYSLLSEAYRTLENPVNDKAMIEGHGERFIFWGFRHLSALQVDFLKALSLRHEIYIPLPQAVFSSLQNSDWPCWLGAKIQTQDKTKEEEAGEIRLLHFAKGRLSEKMLAYDQQAKNSDILLCTESPELDHYLEIPYKNLSYRSSLELWKGDFEKVCELLIERTETYQETLKLLIQEGLQKQNFSRLKILLLIQNVFVEWQGISEAHTEPTFFDEAILREISLLRLPRNFIFPLIKENQGSIYSLREVEGLREERPLYICASSKYEDLKGGSEAYNTRVMEFLRAIGPVQRREFAFSFVKNNLRRILQRPQSLLFFEEGLLEHMLSWSDLFKGMQIVPLGDPLGNKQEKINDPLSLQKKAKRLEKISATSLQGYLDCPRKFYYSHIERVKDRPEFESSLRSDELGTLEHEVIAKYLSKYEQWDHQNHRVIVQEQFQIYLKRFQKVLSLLEREKAFWEISNYSANGIRALLKLKNSWAGMTFSFEEKLQGTLHDLPLRGSADCVIQTPEGWGLLDFKRSKASIPSAKELESLESVQVPFYLAHLSHGHERCLFWGHLNLSVTLESQVFAKDEMTLERLSLADFLEGKKLSCFFPDMLTYLEKEQTLMGQIAKDDTFLAHPLNKDTCTYCSLSNICTRGGEAL